ncbi:MAG: hypothetical protein PF588_07005 [Candidatus Kapabacteria bacterium]|jgi:hypothetical protein|nr:hypothetical protein [Candidatus Kapabacteria bacterium]
MKAKFYAFGTDGKQITILSPYDFEIKENDLPRNVTISSDIKELGLGAEYSCIQSRRFFAV